MPVHLKITAKGQVTLRRDVMRHPGVNERATVEVALLPNGRAGLRAAPQSASIETFFTSLQPTQAHLSLDDIENIAAGWAVPG